jgi:predicted N-acetyltransferase YhbS
VWVYSLFLFARADLNQELRALDDQTTKMILSLLAIENGKAIGHILFTKAQLESTAEVNISILGARDGGCYSSTLI